MRLFVTLWWSLFVAIVVLAGWVVGGWYGASVALLAVGVGMGYPLEQRRWE